MIVRKKWIGVGLSFGLIFGQSFLSPSAFGGDLFQKELNDVRQLTVSGMESTSCKVVEESPEVLKMRALAYMTRLFELISPQRAVSEEKAQAILFLTCVEGQRDMLLNILSRRLGEFSKDLELIDQFQSVLVGFWHEKLGGELESVKSAFKALWKEVYEMVH